MPLDDGAAVDDPHDEGDDVLVLAAAPLDKNEKRRRNTVAPTGALAASAFPSEAAILAPPPRFPCLPTLAPVTPKCTKWKQPLGPSEKAQLVGKGHGSFECRRWNPRGAISRQSCYKELANAF